MEAEPRRRAIRTPAALRARGHFRALGAHLCLETLGLGWLATRELFLEPSPARAVVLAVGAVAFVLTEAERDTAGRTLGATTSMISS